MATAERPPNPCKDSRIHTFTGRLVDPLNLKPEDVQAEDVAHSLAHQCRFTGHVRRFYSVAEHSVRVAILADHAYRADNPDRRDARAILGLWRMALAHDATEAYLADLPRPLKDYGPLGAVYRQVELKLAEVIGAALGTGQDRFPESFHALVKRSDQAILGAEAARLMNRQPDGTAWWDGWPDGDLVGLVDWDSALGSLVIPGFPYGFGQWMRNWGWSPGQAESIWLRCWKAVTNG